jgi:hypothetical protein
MEHKLNYQIIDNFLPVDDFEAIKITLTTPQATAWFYNDVIAGGDDLTNNPSDYYFTHLLYSDYRIRSDLFKLFEGMLKQLDAKAVVRIKGNMYPNTPKVQHHADHQDYDFSHKAALLFVNDNNGFTVLDNKISIESKANRVLIFDPTIPHHSTTCSDQKFRMTVNFNYF